MRETIEKSKTAIITRTGTAGRATVGENIALSIVMAIALTCAAIGAWSLLALANSLASYGAGGLFSGLITGLTGQ